MLQKPDKPIALLIAIIGSCVLMANNSFTQKVQANSMALTQTQVEEKLQSLYQTGQLMAKLSDVLLNSKILLARSIL